MQAPEHLPCPRAALHLHPFQIKCNTGQLVQPLALDRLPNH